MAEPLILEVKGNSLDDGPGIRTIVFFKGCPLSCSWCHNPESKRTGRQLSFDPRECAECGHCIEICPRAALDRGREGFIDRERCDLCLKCADECPAEALTRVGRRMSTGEIAALIERDIPFFRTSGGGVTLSGGEPTMFMDYASRLLEALRGMGIHTIVETCGQFSLDDFRGKVAPFTDAIYFDLKLIDPLEHKRQCGVSNELILENFGALARDHLEGGRPVLPRIPLVPGITATDENLSGLSTFLRKSGVREVALLPYNPLWLEKSRKVGRASPFEGEERMTSWMKPSEIERCRRHFAGLEIS